MTNSQAPANRLIHEASPYLLQHARNPVDWHPWGPEAIGKAQALDRPIFLSIGYSACHWCHVMERESFEDPATAELLNRYFINVKVDREERPDLDQIYMNAVVALTRHGGWPMSVWLTPELKPFYGGTYFPPVRRFQMPAFREIIEGVAQAWRERRAEVETAAGELTEHLARLGQVADDGGELDLRLVEKAGRAISRIIDPRHGGLGGAPKFPHSVEMRLLLRASRGANAASLAEQAVFSLEKMARGGIFDQLGGGYHRYSTDEQWLVPHFEKMLYDNALITIANVEAWRLTGNAELRDAACRSMDYVLREMTGPEGAFFSAQDADSEGVEGKFFVWTKAEILEALGESDGEAFCYCYDVTDVGNWEHRNILNRPKTLEQCAKLLGTSPAELNATLSRSREKLFAVRSRRIPPPTDDKVLTSWNAMAIEALALTGSTFARPDFTAAAAKAADFLMHELRDSTGRLLRVYKTGVGAKLNAYLEDYSFLAFALVSLYEATFEPRWLEEAAKLLEDALERFADRTGGGFFSTSHDHERLIARGKDPADGAIPSGNAMAAAALVRVWRMTGRSDFADAAEKTFRVCRGLMEHSPAGAARMLIALEEYLGAAPEIAIVGKREDDRTRRMLEVVRTGFFPDAPLAVAEPGRLANRPDAALFEGKTAGPDGGPAAYVCRRFACAAPVFTAEELRAALRRD